MPAQDDFGDLPVVDQLAQLGVSLEDRVDYLTVYRLGETWGAKSTSLESLSFADETTAQMLAATADKGWEPLKGDFGPDRYVFRRPRP